jgi:multicomponent Na+:H+ antiporter subunit E
MNFALLTIVLALGWAAATDSFTLPNLLFGLVVASVASLFIRDRVSRPGIPRRAMRILALAWLFLVELVVSAVRVAFLVVRPDMRAHLRPAIVAFPLRLQTDAEIALLANLITLTPGTLSVDVSQDRKSLYVHAIAMADRDKLIGEIASGFELRILEAFE